MSQRVLITAGAGGIGLAIAEAFAANGAVDGPRIRAVFEGRAPRPPAAPLRKNSS